jgi:hypothetical protein
MTNNIFRQELFSYYSQREEPLSNKDLEGGQTYISFFNNICKQLLKAGSNFVKSGAIPAMQVLLTWVKKKG